MNGAICKTCGTDHSATNGMCPGLFIQPRWNGEGLPPVELVVEFHRNKELSYRDTIPVDGTRMLVVAHFMGAAVCAWQSPESCHAETFTERSLKPMGYEKGRKREAIVSALYAFTAPGKAKYYDMVDAIIAGKIPGVKLEDV